LTVGDKQASDGAVMKEFVVFRRWFNGAL